MRMFETKGIEVEEGFHHIARRFTMSLRMNITANFPRVLVATWHTSSMDCFVALLVFKSGTCNKHRFRLGSGQTQFLLKTTPCI